MTLHAPQVIWFIFLAIGLMIIGHRHGRKKEGEYNMWVDLVGYCINGALLYWGGFFG